MENASTGCPLFVISYLSPPNRPALSGANPHGKL
jgi:hypothetical protein